MAAAFRLLVSTLRSELARGRLVKVAVLMLTLVTVGAPHASAQEVVEYYATDVVGSIRVVFAPDGAVKARSDYLPFGEEWQPTTIAGPLPAQRFTGQRRDLEENLEYFNARSYEVRTGRFTTVDPVLAGLFEPQAWNRYAYALNNPLAFVDPTGLQAASCTKAVGKIVVDGIVWDVHDGGCVNGSPGGGGGGGGGFVDRAWDLFQQWRRNFYDTAEGDPDWVPFHGGGRGPSVTDPDGINGPESAPNATDMTPAIIEGVQAALSGGTKPALSTVANKVGNAIANQAGQKAKDLFNKSSADAKKGTSLPRDLREQYAIDQVKSAPLSGRHLENITLGDPRWPASDGWVKMQQIVEPGGRPINVHYVFNTRTGQSADFKIVTRGETPRP